MTTNYDRFEQRTQHPCYARKCDVCREVFDDTYNGIRYFCVYSMIEAMSKNMNKTDLIETMRHRLYHLKMRDISMNHFIDCAYGYAKYSGGKEDE